MEIEIRVKPSMVSKQNYDDAKAHGEVPWVIQRIASVCCNHPSPRFKEQGYPWTLDNSNDWKAGRMGAELGRDGDENVIVVDYRYGTETRMNNLKAVLEDILGDTANRLRDGVV